MRSASASRIRRYFSAFSKNTQAGLGNTRRADRVFRGRRGKAKSGKSISKGRRRRRNKLAELARTARVRQNQTAREEEDAVLRLRGGGRREGGASAVFAVAEDGRANLGEMNAELMHCLLYTS
ncbi:MAG: hypothetical protein MPK62_10710, partial [Alphaproteobacteria bacterium]|nr:hypothetical protein [Alphaproteobacteria bacterium]